MKPKSDSGQCGSTNFSFKTTHQAEPVLCFSIIVDCVNGSTLIYLSIHILPPSWFKCSCRACTLRQAASRPLNINASSHEVMVAPSRRCCWQMMGLSSSIENTRKVASQIQRKFRRFGLYPLPRQKCKKNMLNKISFIKKKSWNVSSPARRIHHGTCSRLVCCSLRHHVPRDMPQRPKVAASSPKRRGKLHDDWGGSRHFDGRRAHRICVYDIMIYYVYIITIYIYII